MPVSFATDIRPLFRESDVDSLQEFGLDLSSYEDVKARAGEIYERLQYAPGPEEQVSLFKVWMDDGMAP